MKEIQARKKDLKREISNLENGFQSRITGIKRGVDGIERAKNFIQRKPITSVVISTGIGIATGLLRRKKKVVVNQSVATDSITSFIIRELKQVAARKAMLYFSDFIDQQISSLQEKSGKKR